MHFKAVRGARAHFHELRAQITHLKQEVHTKYLKAAKLTLEFVLDRNEEQAENLGHSVDDIRLKVAIVRAPLLNEIVAQHRYTDCSVLLVLTEPRMALLST